MVFFRLWRNHYVVCCLSLLIFRAPRLAASSYVNSLTYEQLPGLLETSPALLIFTAQWCEHSKALAPEIKALATAARKTDLITVARVDADEEPALPARFDLNAYPTMLYFERSFPLADKARRPIEFGDYRWAEVIAEFVNNQTHETVLDVQPRPAYLRWREKNPYNLGEQASRTADESPPPEGSFDDLGITLLREPLKLTSENFDPEVTDKPHIRVLALFYTDDDPLGQEERLQWRQASSAFTGADNVTIALIDISSGANSELRKRFDVEDTPHCLYFPPCDKTDESTDCRSPYQCVGDLDHTENIIQFLSDRVMEEIGLAPDEEEAEGGSTYTLSEEEYRKMKDDGVVFANDADHQDKMRSIYAEHAARQSKDTGLKEEL